jgi:hypothetical protein
MKNIYYLIWADSILSIKKYHPKKTDWKITVFILNTWINALSLWIILLWLKYLKVLIIPRFHINIFPGTLIDGFLAFTIELALPFGILNYFLIFYKNRYKQIIEKYPFPQKRLHLFIHSSTVALAAFVSAIIYGAIK